MSSLIQFNSIYLFSSQLKTMDTIGNCQRLVFSLGLGYLNMHKITNLWKFKLNWSLKLRDINERKNTQVVTPSCVLSADAWFRSVKIKFWGLKIKLVENFVKSNFSFLSRKLRYFRRSRFSHCFILSTSPHYTLPSKV